jgi:hypothetical protein
MFGRRINITDNTDYSAFIRPLSAVPERIESAIARGVQSGRDFPFASAGKLLDPDGDGLSDAVVRNSDGVLVVACRTEMSGVTPEMWDWWFGWHPVSSQRYRLWHPREHLSSASTEDRTHLKDLKARYIGVTSFVEERIGDDQVHKLAISFQAPSELGLDETKLASQGTAICARGALPNVFAEVSYLVHFVRRTSTGSEMLSRFWLGHVRSRIPIVGELVSRKLNTRSARITNNPDAFGLRLLRHCSEEMTHLSNILPNLYAAFAKDL